MSVFYTLYGGLGSPYSIKMRAILRYRRIPHIWSSRWRDVSKALQQVKVPVMPVLESPSGAWANDSTMLILDLEQRYKKRPIVPAHPALAFLACLIEDFADEWCTKIMFEYRWRRALDQDVVSRRLAYDANPGASEEDLEKWAQHFKERQVARMDMIGCSTNNQPIIERSFKELLLAVASVIKETLFLFGRSPTLADFGLFGQLYQLADDPTPREIISKQAADVMRWVALLDDASAVEPADNADVDAVIAHVQPLLALIGAVYLPYLDVNSKALDAQKTTFDVTLFGRRYTQAPVKYQAKCYAALQGRYTALGTDAKALLAPAFSAADLAAFFPR